MSEGYLRRLLHASGVPLAPLVDGVRQDSFEALERTLLRLGEQYAEAAARGDKDRMKACRRLVITAKDHARLAMRKAGETRRREKEEMALWMLTWLENPGVFPLWLELRKRARAAAGA